MILTLCNAQTLGLRESDMLLIQSELSKYSEIDKAVVFGSRAKGIFKNGSDIDLAVFGDYVSSKITNALEGYFEDESPMPYFFDIVDATHLTHEGLRAHIDRVGKIIYQKPI